MPYRPQRIPARNPTAALDRFVDFMAQSLRCLDRRAVWVTGTPDRAYAAALPEDARTLFVANAPLTLPSDGPVSRLYFTPGQTFEVVRDERQRREWRVHTLGYIYIVALDVRMENVVLQWHYHPYAGRNDTHVHVTAERPDLGRLESLHLPTGRVSFESLVRFLITDLRVVPAREDWQDALDDAETRFRAHRRWS